MKSFLIGLGICISIYSTFYYLQCKNKKAESKNDKEEINNDEEKGKINNDKSTQTENLIKNIDGAIDNKEIIKEVLDDIITSVEKESQEKKTSVSFDEDFEVIQ